MTTTSLQTYNSNRDAIIQRAFRIVGVIGQGETLDTTAANEAAIALNHLIKAWQADGMPLWEMSTYTVTPVVSQASYTIGASASYSLNQPAFLKIVQAWSHSTTNGSDNPNLILTRYDYNMLSNKTQTGSPNQVYYDPPRAVGSSGVPYGTLYVWPVPDANYVSSGQIMISGYKMYDDMNSSTDTFDLPQYWQNALVWGLADQLAYEYGVGLSERAMISKKADAERQFALSFGTEEGSYKLQPTPSWHWETYQ